jgi:hypothetical protein
MDVDARPVSRGEIEDDVQMPDRVAVHAGGIDAADRLDSLPERLLEQLGGARVAQQPVLRERDLLHRDAPVEPLHRGAHRLDAAQPDLRIDVRVAPHVRRPRHHHPLQQRHNAIDARNAQLAAAPAIVGDPILERIAGRVRDPRPAVERLVEVAVSIDEPRQHEAAVNIQHLGIARIDAGLDPLDGSRADQHVRGSVEAPRPGPAQQQIGHPNTPHARHV